MRLLAAGSLLLGAVVLFVPGLGQAESSSWTLKLEATVTSNRNHDVSPKGRSQGDTIRVSSKLKNTFPWFGKAKGDVVGSDRRSLQFVDASTAVADGVTTIPGGTIRVHGRVHVQPSGAFVVPITGGTYDYAPETGTLTVTPIGTSGSKWLYVFRLSF
jgi:hypothetical protein